MPTQDLLLDAIYAAPHDDAPRDALAAHLVDTPRGEFLSIQLAVARAGRATREDAARQRALLAEHADEWLAPLRGALVKRSVKWSRGFPVAGQLAAQRMRDAAGALIGLPALATLHTLALELPNTVVDSAWVEAFVWAAPLRHLRSLSGFHRSLLPALLRTQPPFALETLEVALEGGGGPAGERGECATLAALYEAGRRRAVCRTCARSGCRFHTV